MAKKNRCEEPKNLPGWIVTFADLNSLLLVFFILLISMSTIDIKKARMALDSLKKAFGVLNSGQSTKIGKQLVVPEPDMQSSKAAIKKRLSGLKNFINTMGLSRLVVINEGDRGIVVTIQNRLLFDKGSAKLKDEAKIVLDKLSNIIKLLPEGVRVDIQGNTDNLPTKTKKYASNWELSIARALSVVKYFIKYDSVSPTKLSAEGFGQYNPIATNATAEGRERNRRVDIVFEGIH